MLDLFNRQRINGLNPPTIIFSVGLILGLYFLYTIREILVLLFLAFILMVALNPISKKLQRWLRIPRIASMLIAYLLLIAIIILFFALLLPPLVTQFSGLIKFVDFPVVQEKLLAFNFSMSEISNIASQVGTSVSAIWTIIGTTFNSIFTFITLLVLSFFMLQERQVLPQKMFWLIKNKQEINKLYILLDSIEEQLGGWVRGELILMLVIGLFTFIGLSLLGIQYALPLAILAGVLEIVPNIGPTIAAVPAVMIAFITGGPVLGMAVLIFNILVQQLENNIIVPRVMKASANVNPLVSIVAILIGLEIGGVMGALLAVPTYIVFRILYSTYLYQYRL